MLPFVCYDVILTFSALLFLLSYRIALKSEVWVRYLLQKVAYLSKNYSKKYKYTKNLVTVVSKCYPLTEVITSPFAHFFLDFSSSLCMSCCIPKNKTSQLKLLRVNSTPIHRESTWILIFVSNKLWNGLLILCIRLGGSPTVELSEVQDQRPGCSSGAPEEVRPSASSPLLLFSPSLPTLSSP